jgi:cysteine desulfurase family protein
MRIYLDNAATSWPKPEAVYAAVDRYQRHVGAAAGRSAYRDAGEAQRVVDAARRGCAAVLGVLDPTRIVFGANGTDVLNLAIHGILRPGDRVVTTEVEHNSVLRPLAEAARTKNIEVSYIGCDAAGFVDPATVRQVASAKSTRLVAVSHASNVTGAIQPIRDIVKAAHEAHALVLVDAAQSAGHVRLAAQDLGVDLLATSGHKGLLGPLGTGVLYVRSGLEKELQPIRQGGTGLNSTQDEQPAQLPERYEAGNLNTPALAGLAAATQFLSEQGMETIVEQESRLVERLLRGLGSLSTVKVYGPAAGQPRVAVVSFAVEGYDPQDFAAALDSSFGVQCRAGLHCAPRMHAALRTVARGGTVRLSCGWSTTETEVDRALEAVAAIAGA